jgi:hypothetical protein
VPAAALTDLPFAFSSALFCLDGKLPLYAIADFASAAAATARTSYVSWGQEEGKLWRFRNSTS